MPMPKLEPIQSWLQNVRQTPSPPYLIEDIIADTCEVNAIVGRSEIGKTNFCNQLAHCLAIGPSGGQFLGYNVLRSVSVAYIGFEVDQHQLQIRTDKLEKNIHNSPNLSLCNPSPMFKLDGKTEDDFKRTIEGFKVVIIDPVKYIVPGDYSKPEVITQFMERLIRIIRENGSLAIVVLFFKKIPKQLHELGDLWNLKGGTEWGEMASTVFMLERRKQGHKSQGGGFAPVNKDEATLYFAKSRNSVSIHDPIDIKWHRDKCMFELA